MNNVERYLSDIRPEDITKQEGNFSLALYMSLLPECYAPYFTRYYDFDFGSFLFLVRPHHGKLFFNLESYKRTTRTTFKRLAPGVSLDDLPEVRDFRATCAEIAASFESFLAMDLSAYDEKELVGMLAKRYDEFCRLLSSSLFSEAVYEDLVHDIYLELGGTQENFSDFLAFASLPTFESFSLRSDKVISRFAVDQDVSRTTWLYTDYFDALSLEETEAKMRAELDSKGGAAGLEKEIAQLESEIEGNRAKVRGFSENLDPTLRQLFDFTQLAMEIRDVRKTYLQPVLTMISMTGKAVLKERGIEQSLFPYTIYSDWSAGGYAMPGFKAELERRRECAVFFDAEGAHFEYTSPDQADARMDVALKPQGGQDVSELEGQVACPGKVIGPVRVIYSQKDFASFKAGEVLVTSMTRPESVPLMKIASAIITDEGGITCHAAIVSRELKKPCIIGTRVATSVLHDGDEVEVDAEKGIVRILRKKY